MYIKYKEKLLSHSNIMLSASEGQVDKSNLTNHNTLSLDTVNIASFSELITGNVKSSTRYHLVAEDLDCVFLTTEVTTSVYKPVALVFKGSDIEKYVSKMYEIGKFYLRDKYFSSVVPFSLTDASGATSISAVDVDPSYVVYQPAGEANGLADVMGADSGKNTAGDWYDDSVASEDYYAFYLCGDPSASVGLSVSYTRSLGYVTADSANRDGIMNMPNVVKAANL